jgi:hypothetical protein
MVKPKWILQLLWKFFFNGLSMEGYQTLTQFWVHHNVSTLRGRANKPRHIIMDERVTRRMQSV